MAKERPFRAESTVKPQKDTTTWTPSRERLPNGYYFLLTIPWSCDQPDVPGNKSLVMSKIPPWATTQSLKGLLDTKCGDGNGKVKAVYFVKKLDDAADFTPGKLK